jgi:P4 family phage/plasmid primase-like protien
MNEETTIQIIGYRSFINASTGKPAMKQVLFPQAIVTNSIGLLNNLQKIVSCIPEHERYDLHYTNAECFPQPKTGALRAFYRQNMIPIDLDGIDLEKSEKYIEIVLKTLKLDRNKTGIYCSGNGLHLVAVLEEYFDQQELQELKPYYKEACNQINLAIYNEGMIGHADHVRLAESSTLRLPLTENRKDINNPKQTYIIQENVEPQSLDLKNLFTVSIEETKEIKEYPTDTPAVLAGCDFLKWCKENPNKISEPQWYGMMGILAFVPGIGENLCHTYSRDAVSYDEDTTQNKYEQARAVGKPRVCDGIDQLWNRCSECPFYKKVKTPLQIRSEKFVATQKDGFHFITVNKEGKTSYKADYDGLANYYGQLNPYITNLDTREVMKFNGRHWETVDDLVLTAFATSNFVPLATNSMRAEFLGTIKNKNVSVKSFIGKDNNDYINFNNGILNLKSRELIPHSMSMGFTYCLPYDYNPNAQCPNFDKMMDNITIKDEDLKKVILEFVGYAISGRPNSWIQKVMVLSGEGSNGKSTFMNIIRRLVGEECYSAISIASMAKESNRYTMYGKLFNISFDEDPKALIKGGVSIFKAITAGDPVDIRQLYAMPISAPINAKLIVACNKPLETNDHTHAVYRRMLIIPFRAKFEGKTDDKNITTEIYKEMSGIYNRVLDGLDRLIKKGGEFSESLTVTRALSEYKYESAIFQRFFEDCFELTKDKAHFTAVNEIMTKFHSWCDINNEKSDVSSIKLMKELKSLNLLNPDYADKVQNKRGYRGLKELGLNF